MESWPSHWAAPCKLESLLHFWFFIPPHFFFFFLGGFWKIRRRRAQKCWDAQRSSQFPHKIFLPQLQIKSKELHFYFDFFIKKNSCYAKMEKIFPNGKLERLIWERMGSTPPPQECSILSWNRVNKLGFFPHNNAFSQGGNSLNEKCSFINILVASYLEIKCSLLPLHCRRRWSHFAHLEISEFALFAPFRPRDSFFRPRNPLSDPEIPFQA